MSNESSTFISNPSMMQRMLQVYGKFLRQRKKENQPTPLRIFKQYFVVIRFCVIPSA